MTDRSPFLWIILPMAPMIVGFLLLNIVNGPNPPPMDPPVIIAAETPGSASLAQIDPPQQGASPQTTQSPEVSDTTITPHLPRLEDMFPQDRDMRFFGALMIYVSTGLFHVFACAAVIGLMGLRIVQLPAPARRTSLIVLGGLIVLLVAANLAVQVPGLNGALTLTYRNSCQVVKQAGVALHLMPPSCTGKGISPFAWLALTPYLFGLLAAAFAAAVTCTAYRAVAESDVQAELDARAAIVDQAFRCTALVLVTSALTMKLFYDLPLSLIPEDTTPLTLMQGYAQGMALFWGTVFTLTLIAIFGPGYAILKRQLQTRNIEAELPEVLTGKNVQKYAVTALTMLAPLLVGASGSLLEQLAGAL